MSALHPLDGQVAAASRSAVGNHAGWPKGKAGLGGGPTSAYTSTVAHGTSCNPVAPLRIQTHFRVCYALCRAEGREVAMTMRPSHDSGCEFALWGRRCVAGKSDSFSVVIVHPELAMGESIALLLRLRGVSAVNVRELEAVQLMLEHWSPGVLLIDTRLGSVNIDRLMRYARREAGSAQMLFVALTGNMSNESPAEIRKAGFDGFFRRLCPVWRIADILDEYWHR